MENIKINEINEELKKATDSTVKEICEKHGIKIVEETWNGFRFSLNGKEFFMRRENRLYMDATGRGSYRKVFEIEYSK